MDILATLPKQRLEAGQTKTIFYDPLTEQNPEGEAVLVKLVVARGQSEYWRVRFLADSFTANRFIKKP